MPTKPETFSIFGETYVGFLGQFTKFMTVVDDAIKATPIPSFEMSNPNDHEYYISYMGHKFKVQFDCFVRNGLLAANCKLDPYIRFSRFDTIRTLSLDKHGNVNSVDSGSNIGNIDQDPLDVFLTAIGSLVRDPLQ